MSEVSTKIHGVDKNLVIHPPSEQHVRQLVEFKLHKRVFHVDLDHYITIGDIQCFCGDIITRAWTEDKSLDGMGRHIYVECPKCQQPFTISRKFAPEPVIKSRLRRRRWMDKVVRWLTKTA